MATWSIRRRLIRSLIVLLATCWIIGVVAAALVVRHEIKEVFDSALRETAGDIVPVALSEYNLQKAGRTQQPGTLPVALRMARGHVHFFLRDRAGNVLLASSGAPRDPPDFPLSKSFKNDKSFRYYTQFLETDDVWIQVGQELKERHEAVMGLWIGLASPLLALLPIAAFAVWHTVGRATAPITTVSRELETRGGDRLDPIDGTAMPDELVPVVDSVNTLMQRLKAVLESERAFAGNAAHELRNPIASARAQIQVLAGNLAGTPGQARAENISSQLGQLGRRIEKLLQMSRAEAGLGQSRERTDLAAIAELLVDEYRRRPDVRNRLNLVTPGDGCWVAMDQDALAIVLRNVIENAVSHGASSDPIDVRVGEHTVSVVNACPPVPPDVLLDLKSRFRRGISNGGGSGLGLAIVDTIMRQAGGRVELMSPARDRSDGFEIDLVFPGAL